MQETLSEIQTVVPIVIAFISGAIGFFTIIKLAKWAVGADVGSPGEDNYHDAHVQDENFERYYGNSGWGKD
jgi:hypothetical protein